MAMVEREEVWSGGVHVTLDCARDEAWAIFADFGGLCKWNPAITVCDLVEGKDNEAGSVRYCRGTLPDSWVYERLLVHDEENHLCKYQMEDNRFRFRDGVQGYVSQIQFRDVENGKISVDWTYTVQPVATQTRELFTTFMTEFYLSNLNFLQSAAIARTSSSLNSAQKQDVHRNSAHTVRANFSMPDEPSGNLGVLCLLVDPSILHLQWLHQHGISFSQFELPQYRVVQ